MSIDSPVSEYSDDYDWWMENCSIIPPEMSRVLLVGVVGAIIASVSVFFNTFLFCVLFRNKRHRSSHLIYLTFLALADIFLSAAYILLFPVNVYMDFFDSEWLSVAWYSYMKVIITISHVFISASAFLIVAAAFERYLSIAKIHNQFAQHHRLVISLIALICALMAKLPMYFEVEVIPNGNCTGVTSMTATVAVFSDLEPYKTYYKYWFRNLFTIFIPFVLCFYLNFEIIRRLRLQHKGAKMFRFATSEHRQNIRSATLMLVFVTCTYLASNLLNVVVYTWELIDKPSLMSERLRPFYTLSSDLVSVLTVLASACRLPIYIACNARIRCEVLNWMDACVMLHFRLKPFKSSPSTKGKRSRATTVRYCDTGSGFMICEQSAEDSPREANQSKPRMRSIGTGLDKIVLSVAMCNAGSRNFLSVPLTTTLEECEDNKDSISVQ